MFQSFDVTARPEVAPPRVAKLRAWLAAHELDAFLVPRADAHQGEYVAPCDERLAWITGFTGSAGLAVIGRDRAAVFTDGRYTVQIRAQTDPATFEIRKWPGETVAAWLGERLPKGARVGFDPMLHTVREIEKLRAVDGVELVPAQNGVDAVWDDRPPRPREPVTAYPTELAGKGDETKRAEIAAALRDAGAKSAVVTQPDAICWLLNIRGSDIARSPLVLAFAVVHADGSVELFSDPAKFDGLGPDPAITLHEWDAFADRLRALDGPVLIDPATAPWAVADALGDRALQGTDPIALPKARKSEAEIAATTEAHLRDGAAMVRFLRWLDEARPDAATEIDVVRQLEWFRRDTNALREISFETIAGSGPHGAIVHYRVNKETNRKLDTDSVLLVDSGGQYIDGTTDITRTVPLGFPPADIAHAFTRVLQGMIAVSRARFPVGVAGAHLDALARAPLWAEHRDYDHGTGHGVGVYLGVHEGPARISRVSTIPLEAGMILSNEPGYYREGEYGIRIENLIVVRPAEPLPGGDPEREMLRFDTLTWVPIDRRLIVAALLSPDERTWLDAYHAGVLERLAPRLAGPDLDWLTRMCAPI
ncbi:aminopeptidase P family protein [Jannaschia ovalis]|uniref:Aminopeptidase P family protein n=1 Tax=Jannaschia ovalis TaxID=3038773 RepID=A0ABY8L9I8_9RHOB|nr:aminopeptidase P family protein [Jannaschia sp. GRR-S6-38]WGH78012.1 aminopeptidase P family protein [Jannaschia sp. GRR-S6-38]